MRDCRSIVEFGTSKITCTIAEQKPRKGLEVLGCAQVPYAGIKNSNWVDSERVYYALEEALSAAEHQADYRLRNVDVGIPGSFLQIANRTAQISTNGRVSEQDIDHLVDKASQVESEEGMVMLEAVPSWFLLDDGNIYLDPAGVNSKRMRGSISFTFANRFFLNDVAGLLRHMGVRLNSFIAEPLAQALYLVPQENRDDLAVLVDIGYSTTNVSVIYGDSVLHFDTIPLGGANIAADIAYVMKVDADTAEQLKRRYSFGLAANGSIPYMYIKDSGGKLRKYPYDVVKGIIDARVEQIVEFVMQIVTSAEVNLKKKLDIFLTGGGISFMRGANSFFKSVSGRTPLPINVNSIKLSDPNLHASYAMLQYAYGDLGVKPKQKKRGLFGKQEEIY
ncbi:MAG: hypothetical protein HDQ87_11245 [Clostridia bacterium]|nr:hypothetical protein [Clostridia bacterium]